MSRIHWLTPSITIAALLFAVVLALGHHLFYNSLDRRPVSTEDELFTVLGDRFSSQQVNIAIGTAFAVLVKSGLVLAASTAYLQAVVWDISRSSRKEISTISNVDVLMASLQDFMSLLRLDTWWRRPLLFLAALVVWLIPIASIVTPATLSVGISTPPSRLMHVPSVAFSSLNLAADMNYFGYSPSTTDNAIGYAHFAYQGPSNTVRRIVGASAARGEILPIAAPAPNSSWTSSFAAPALSCNEVEGETRRLFIENIVNYTAADRKCYWGPGYVAWHPNRVRYNSSAQDLLPFHKHADLRNDTVWNTPDYSPWGEIMYADQAMFFVAVTEPLMSALNSQDPGPWEDLCWGDKVLGRQKAVSLLSDTGTILRCDVHNSTYHTRFEFENGEQTVNVNVTDIANKTVETVGDVTGVVELIDPSDMLSDWKGAVHPCGEADWWDYQYASDDMGLTTWCANNPEVPSALSYQAITHALIEVLRGTVQRIVTQQSLIDSGSLVTTTVLTQSPELMFLEELTRLEPPNTTTLQKWAQQWEAPMNQGLTTTVPGKARLPLREALEQMFTNITLSLMSAPELQPNASSAFAPDPVSVTFSMRQNIYLYSPTKLWASYGAAILLATLVVLFGLVSTWRNQASYSAGFSTMLRLSRGAQLSTEIKVEDMDGRDPVPDYLAKSRVRFADGGRDGTWDSGYEAVGPQEEKGATVRSGSQSMSSGYDQGRVS